MMDASLSTRLVYSCGAVLMWLQCDEERPTCRKCFTRGLVCDFDESTRERQLTSFRNEQGQQQHSSPGSGAFLHSDPTRARLLGQPSCRRELDVPSLDLESLQLMHHFEHFTSDTLLFGKRLWRDEVLSLALQVRDTNV